MNPLPLALAVLLGADPVAEPPPSPPRAAEEKVAPAEPPTASPETPEPSVRRPEEGAPPPPAPASPAPAASPEPPERPPATAEAERAPEPPRAATPPGASAPSAPVPVAGREAPDWTQPGGATPYTSPHAIAAQASAPRETSAVSAAPRRPYSPEWGLQAGWSAVTLAGVGATGPDVRLALSAPHGGFFPGTAVLSVETFFGETETGMPVRSLTVDAELWVPAGRFLRLGAGLGLGLAGYKRATSGEWPVTLPLGLRVGAEVAPLRWRRSALVVGAHLAGHIDEQIFWGSATLVVGLRFAGAPSRAEPGAVPAREPVRAE